jgi:hypothetical protein
MTDDKSPEMPPLEHDEFHSALEVDDSSGWRVFIVPGVLLLFVIGAILFIVLYQGTAAPDPRIADRLHNVEAETPPEDPGLAPTVPAASAPVAAEVAEGGETIETNAQNQQ